MSGFHNDAKVRVRYAETDQMGVVYHANYLIWFEVGRVEMMRAVGLDYKQMEIEHGCGIAVVEATARYKAPAKYDDELVVRTQIKAMRSSLLKIGYEVIREADGKVLCEGETTHVVVSQRDGEMKQTTLPEKYAERLRACLI